MKDLIVLDGPMGTELNARGVPTPLPGWSSHALDTHPGVVEEIHKAYAQCGARVHTTNTFRTRKETDVDRWRDWVRTATRLARQGASACEGGRVAGSIAPIEDCYRPDLSPAKRDPVGTMAAHCELADALQADGCDLLLCETFPDASEGLIAVEAAVATGLETWASFTPGPKADLMTVREFVEAGRRAADLGAQAVLVNCLPSDRVLEFLMALCDADLPKGVAIGAYANTGLVNDGDGWTSAELRTEQYLKFARAWRAAGASILGGCCGTGPKHVIALASLADSH
ncbi:MAG: S-methylmethionine-dependent homocysteine/selenocysteine methylase [Planctomycetota bacterium]|jgi:S-methylmethionine-dependent homocysteine/selenocysteine methylase